jgi:hypothetical protein
MTRGILPLVNVENNQDGERGSKHRHTFSSDGYPSGG